MKAIILILIFILVPAMEAHAADPSADIPILKEKAEKGDAAAQSQLSFLYEIGRGVPQDNAESLKWQRKAAESGYADAEHGLGIKYIEGNGVSRDYKLGMQWLDKAVKQNDLHTLYQLCGDDFKYGTPEEKTGWCLKAAELGDIGAYPILGRFYESGNGVPQDLIKAYAWYSLKRDSYEKLDVVTQKMTPEQLVKGKQLVSDLAAKMKKDTSPKDGGGVWCIWEIYVTIKKVAEACPMKSEVKRDIEESYFWASIASQDTHVIGADSLRHGVGLQLNQGQRFEIQKRVRAWKSDSSGSGEAELEKATGYQHDLDNKSAVQWYLVSAKKGNSQAQYKLAQLYAEGGADVSDKDAIKTLDGAIDQINSFIIANSSKPITKAEIEEKARNWDTHMSSCKGTEDVRNMMNSLKSIPLDEFKRNTDEFLSVPRVPQLNPCL